jgi:hypothetical protein
LCQSSASAHHISGDILFLQEKNRMPCRPTVLFNSNLAGPGFDAQQFAATTNFSAQVPFGNLSLHSANTQASNDTVKFTTAGARAYDDSPWRVPGQLDAVMQGGDLPPHATGRIEESILSGLCMVRLVRESDRNPGGKLRIVEYQFYVRIETFAVT